MQEFFLRRIKLLKYLFIVFVAFYFGISINGSVAQEVGNDLQPLTLQAAIEQAITNHPSLQIQQTFVEQAEGQRTTAGVLPNPTLLYYREDLSLSHQESGEWILFGGLPLNFLWERWSKVASASARVEAQEFLVGDARRFLTFEVQKAYVQYLYSDKMVEIWTRARTIFEQAVRAGEARFAEGDISRYELQRIKMEQLRYQKAEADAAVERLARKQRLAFLINPETDQPDFEEVSDLIITLPVISPETLIDGAFQNRPDLHAARAMLQSRQSALSSARWQGLPEMSFSYGYKEQQDNFTGSVIQFNLGLPLFDRNQGRVWEAKAALQRQALELKLLEKQVALEIRQGFDQFIIYREQYPQFLQTDEQSVQEMLSAALASYEEGEMSLVELLDAVQSYVESFRIQYDFVTSYHLSLFELEKTTAMSMTEF